MDDRLTYLGRHRWRIWMAYLSRHTDSTEIRQLTGLRGVLALDVVIGHLNLTNMSAVSRIVFHNVAVDFFFTLSGFVLGLTYLKGAARPLDFRRYAVARFARIYPLYLFALLLVMVLLLHWQGDNFRTDPPSRLAREFVSQLLLLGALPIPATGGFWNVPAWSVSAEAFCYLAVFPVLYAATRLVPAGRAWPWFALALLCASCDFLFFRTFFVPAVLGIQTVPMPYGPVWWVALVRATTMFVAGWSVFLALRGRETNRLLFRLGADLLLLLLVALVLFGGSTLVERQRLVFLAPVLIACLSADGSVASRLLSLPPIVYLGRISYSLYLLHVPVLLIAFHCPWVTSGPLRLMAGTVLAALALAAATHAAIEVPMRRLIRSWMPRRPVDRPPASADGNPLPAHRT